MKYNEVFVAYSHFLGEKSLDFEGKNKINSSLYFDLDFFWVAFLKSKISLFGDILKPYHHLMLNPASDACNQSNIKKVEGRKKEKDIAQRMASSLKQKHLVWDKAQGCRFYGLLKKCSNFLFISFPVIHSGYEVKKMKKIGGILKNGGPLSVFLNFFMLLQKWPS
jgi:hypothetical protein